MKLSTKKSQKVQKLDRNKVNESAIDYPKAELCSAVWDSSNKLLPEVKEVLLKQLKLYTPLDLEGLATEIRIVGSIGTNQYVADADIDLHLLVEESSLPKDKTPEEWQKEVKAFFKEDELLQIDDHPVEVYLQYDFEQEEGYAAAIYNVRTDEWEQGPLIVPLDFDPYEYYAEVLPEVQEEVVKVDVALGEMFRDVSDYEEMMNSLETIPTVAKQKILKSMKLKLNEITEKIEGLAAVRQEWKDDRQSASTASAEAVKKSASLRKNWRDENAKFKFIQRYGYIDLIVKLEQFIKTDKMLTNDEIPILKRILKLGA